MRLSNNNYLVWNERDYKTLYKKFSIVITIDATLKNVWKLKDLTLFYLT